MGLARDRQPRGIDFQVQAGGAEPVALKGCLTPAADAVAGQLALQAGQAHLAVHGEIRLQATGGAQVQVQAAGPVLEPGTRVQVAGGEAQVPVGLWRPAADALQGEAPAVHAQGEAGDAEFGVPQAGLAAQAQGLAAQHAGQVQVLQIEAQQAIRIQCAGYAGVEIQPPRQLGAGLARVQVPAGDRQVPGGQG